MKQYFLKGAGILSLLAISTAGSFAQDDAKESTTRKSDDVIIIKPKVNVDTKLTIEIKGDAVTINGKPLAEYKSDDVSVSRRKQLIIENKRLAEMDAMAPPTRFRKGGVTVYGYGNDDNLALAPGMNSNKAFLGVGTEKDEEGVRITSVSDESAAEKAGLKEDDIITKINDTKISSPEELTKTIGKFNPDEKITISYKRDKKEQKTTATLTKRKLTGALSLTSPDAFEGFRKFNMDNNFNYNFAFPGKPRLGIKAQETEEGKGLKVLEVDEESAADKAGIKEGDIITGFDGKEVNDIEALRDLSAPAIQKGNFKVQLTRDGKKQEIEVKIPKKLKTTSL